MKIVNKIVDFIGQCWFEIGKILHLRGYGISILVPFHTSDPHSQRAKNWKWLKEYWKVQLPGAEIIMGEDHEADDDTPFSKSCAVNNAAKKAIGDIFVIVDADGYIPIESVLKSVDEIRKAEKHGKRLWFIPYRHFYRLTEEASQRVLESDPACPYTFGKKPDPDDVLNMKDFNGASGSTRGHHYGALIQVMSREAFECVGGWDPRFRGWGGEDSSAMRAMDTLYWPHKTLPGPVFHIWHPFVNSVANSAKHKSRLWDNQNEGSSNNVLSNRYYKAQGIVDRMRKLVDEWQSK